MNQTSSAETTSRRLAAWLALLAYMALLATLSHQPSLPTGNDWFPHQDKVEHFLAYALLGVLALRALPGVGLRRFLGAMLLSVLFAVSDELHQAWVPGRDPSILDGLADVVGATMGTALATYFGRSQEKLATGPKVTRTSCRSVACNVERPNRPRRNSP